MECLWGVMSRTFCDELKQYSVIIDFDGDILNAWDAISYEDCLKLINSMPKRIFEVIRTSGVNAKC